MALADSTSLGFSGAELLAKVEGTRDAVLHYESGGETGLSLVVTKREDKATLIKYEQPSSVDVLCPDVLQVGLAVQFSTADGGFSEDLAAVASASSLDSIEWLARQALQDVQGSWRPVDLDPADYDSVSLEVSGSVGASSGSTMTNTGTLLLVSSKSDAEAKKGSSEPIASW